MFAAQDRDGKAQDGIGTCQGRLFYQGVKIERRLGRPSRERILHGRSQGLPRARPTPVVDEPCRRSAVVANDHAVTRFTGNGNDFRERRIVALFEKVKGGRFIKRQTCDTVRSLERDVEGKTSAVGMDGIEFKQTAYASDRDSRKAA